MTTGLEELPIGPQHLHPVSDAVESLVRRFESENPGWHVSIASQMVISHLLSAISTDKSVLRGIQLRNRSKLMVQAANMIPDFLVFLRQQVEQRGIRPGPMSLDHDYRSIDILDTLGGTDTEINPLLVVRHLPAFLASRCSCWPA